MKIHPHVTVMLSILMLVGLLGACAPATVSPAQPPAETQPSTAAQPTVSEVKTEKPFGEGKRVAVVFAYGGLGDKSFNDSLFSGMVLASSRMGFAWDYVEPMAAAEYEPMLRNYAESGIYDLVICNGGSCGSSLSTVATDYPQQLFMGDDCVVDLPNVATYNFRTDELAYLVGIVAGSMTKSSKIGFIGGMDIPSVTVAAAGMKAGARAVNPSATLSVGYVGAWDDIGKNKEMALAQYEQGVDFMYHNSSLGGLGMIEAGKQKNFYTVGFDGNQNVLAPDTNLLSGIRSFPQAAAECIEQVLKGEFSAGDHLLGIKEGGVYITNELSNVKIPDEVWEKVEAAKADLISGKVTIPADPAEVP